MIKQFTNIGWIFFFLLICLNSWGGQINGTIKNKNGDTLQNATIYIIETKQTFFANKNGYFNISIENGNYTLQFQYPNHTLLEIKTHIESTPQSINIILNPIEVLLSEVNVSTKSENLATIIMRKAIAVGALYNLAIDSFEGNSYNKVQVKINKIGNAMKMLAKNEIKALGIEVGKNYLLESYLQVAYKNPRSYKEKIISTHSTLPKELRDVASQNLGFEFYSVYEDKLAYGKFSPLSQKAFNYYTFFYAGFFQDGLNKIHKIEVIPKTETDQTFSGFLFVIDSVWALHSLNLNGKDAVNTINLQLSFKPFGNIWIPLYSNATHKLNYLGSELEIQDLQNLTLKKISIHQAFSKIPKIVNKSSKSETTVKKDSIKNLENEVLEVNDIPKITKKLKNELQFHKAEFDYDFSLQTDSLAFENTSIFEKERPIKLTPEEENEFKLNDSLTLLEIRHQKQKDSATKKNKFQFSHLFFGNDYYYGNIHPEYGIFMKKFKWSSFLSPSTFLLDIYNVPIGYYLTNSLEFIQHQTDIKKISLKTDLQYSITKSILYHESSLSINTFQLSGGHTTRQYNLNKPISNSLNANYSLFLAENWIRLYEYNFFKISYKNLNPSQYNWSFSLEYAKRNPIENTPTNPWINPQKNFVKNIPSSTFIDSSTQLQKIQSNETLLFNMNLSWQPFAKKSRYNKSIYYSNFLKPTFKINFSAGLLTSSAFQKITIQAFQNFDFGNWGLTNISVHTGYFFQKPFFFADYEHFNGNQTFFMNGLDHSFNALAYYQYSTNGTYQQAFITHTFVPILLSPFKKLKIKGVKEYASFKILNTPDLKKTYMELSYGINFGNSFLDSQIEWINVFDNFQFQSFYLKCKIPFL